MQKTVIRNNEKKKVDNRNLQGRGSCGLKMARKTMDENEEGGDEELGEGPWR